MGKMQPMGGKIYRPSPGPGPLRASDMLLHAAGMTATTASLPATGPLLGRPHPRAIHPARLAVGGLLALCLAGACWSILADRALQLDFQVFYASAVAWGRGLNPYVPGVPGRILPVPDYMPFIYPPDTLPLFRAFTLLPLGAARAVFLVLQLVLAASLFRQWSRVFLEPGDRANPWFAAFCLFGLGSTFLMDLRAGNISLLEQALLWTGLAAYLRGQTGAFCGWLLAAAAFKWTLLGFSVLLLVDGPAARRQPRWFILVWAVMAVRMALDYVASPALFGGYVHALALFSGVPDTRTGNPSTLEFLRDLVRYNLGDGAIHDLPWLLPASYLAAVAGVGIFSWRAWRTLRARPDGDASRRGVLLVCLAVLAYGLAVPRLKDYSYILLLVPVWMAAKTALAGRRDAWLAVVVIACVAARSPFGPLGAAYAFLWHYQALMVAYAAWALLVWHIAGADRVTPPAA